MSQLSPSDASLLLIDDDSDILHAVADLLAVDGYKITAVSRGALALKCMLEQSFSAAILDVGLPDFDGLTLLNVFRELDPHLPVIMLTGRVTPETTIGSLSKGAFAYLTKPYHNDELRETVRRAVSVRALRSEAKRMERALEESLGRFRALVDSAPDAIVLADQSGAIISCNRSTEQLFGYAPDELIGQPLTVLMPQRFRGAHEAAFQRAAFGGLSGTGKLLEFYGARKDGREFPLELSIGSWQAADGRFFCGILRDVTARKEAEEARHRSEERYRALYHDNPSMYFSLDEEGQILSVNRFGAEQLGYCVDELIGTPVLQLFHDEDKPQVRDRLRGCFGDPGATGEWEFRKVRKDGSMLWVKETVRVVDGPHGGLMALVVCQDITQLKQAEHALRRQERELSDFFENGVLGHHWIGPDGRILKANRAELNLLGYSPHEYVGRPASQFHTEPQVINDVLHRLALGESVKNYEATLRCKDGSVKHVLIDSNVLWENGRFIHTRCFTRDITDQKLAEERLGKINECLLGFGTDAGKNIDHLLMLCGELLKATSVVYTRADGAVTSTTPHWASYGQSQTPGSREGRLCYDLLHGADSGPVVIRNLQQTHYAHTDPDVATHGFHTSMGSVVRSSVGGTGALCVVFQRDYAPTPGDGKLLGIIASAIGVEEDRKRAADQLTAREHQLRHLLEERARISRDLHDGIIQSLYAIGLTLADCADVVSEDPPAVGATLQDVTAQINGVIREIRESIMATTRAPLKGIDLPTALQEVVKAVSHGDGPNIELNVDPQVAGCLVGDMADHLLYIVREGLSNCLRHAHARKVTVSLTRQNGDLSLTIQDDGCGFLPPNGTSTGNGLRNIQERAQLLGATLHIQSAAGAGTQITLTLGAKIP